MMALSGRNVQHFIMAKFVFTTKVLLTATVFIIHASWASYMHTSISLKFQWCSTFNDTT